ncbi:dTMP kinase [Kitasatospora sp. NPDC085464]|uniref:dTMP kinase n=1 Tax=Kitasatospora sp. NPDC085464 TaxID=3364063 RepID=UPI0037C752D6
MESGIRNGRLVAVVGIDGAGKTSQVQRLAEWFEGSGHPTRLFLNQSQLPVRRALDAIAREDGFPGHLDMIGADTIRLISACARLSALAPVGDVLRTPGAVALADRYTVCQYAAVRLQGADNEAFLRRLNRGLPKPDLTLFLDVDPAVARERIRRRGIDEETLEFLAAYREAYRSLPEFADLVVVDGNGSFDEVQELLRKEIQRALPRTSAAPTGPVPCASGPSTPPDEDAIIDGPGREPSPSSDERKW